MLSTVAIAIAFREFAGGKSEKFARARGGGDRKLRGVVEALRHHRDRG